MSLWDSCSPLRRPRSRTALKGVDRRGQAGYPASRVDPLPPSVPVGAAPPGTLKMLPDGTACRVGVGERARIDESGGNGGGVGAAASPSGLSHGRATYQRLPPAREVGGGGGGSDSSRGLPLGWEYRRGGGRNQPHISIHNTLRVGVLNVDGATVINANQVVVLMEHYELDVLILVEVKWYGQRQAEFAAALLAAYSCRAGPPLHVAAARCRSGSKGDGPRACGHGGVAAVVRGNIDVTVWSPLLSEAARGEVAAAAGTDGGDVGAEDVLYLQARRRGDARFTRIIGVYLSPALPRPQVECRLRRISHAVGLAVAAGETVVVCGDLNARMGGGTAYSGAGQYRTVDGGTTPHTAPVCEFLGEAGLQPVHGMPQGQRQADWTNSPAAGSSVVDYILVSSATAADVVVRAAQTRAGDFSAPLSPLSALATSHALLTVEVRGAVAAVAAARRGAGRSNKLTGKPLPDTDDDSGLRDAFDATMCRVIAAGVQHALALCASSLTWVEEDRPRRDTPAVRVVLAEQCNAALTRPVAEHMVATLGRNPRVHHVVEQCALGMPQPPVDAVARELFDRLAVLPVPRWQDIPAPVPANPPPPPPPPPPGGVAGGGIGGVPRPPPPAAVAAAGGGGAAPGAVPVPVVGGAGGAAECPIGEGEGAAAAAAVAPPPAASPPPPSRPTISSRILEREEAEVRLRVARADTLRLRREASAVTAEVAAAAAGVGRGGGGPFIYGAARVAAATAAVAAAAIAERKASDACRQANTLLKRLVRRKRAVGIISSGGRSSHLKVPTAHFRFPPGIASERHCGSPALLFAPHTIHLNNTPSLCAEPPITLGALATYTQIR